MVIQKNENLRFIQRLCYWLDEMEISDGYFYEILEKQIGELPLKISNFNEFEGECFSFLCSSKNSAVIYQVILSVYDKSRTISFSIPNSDSKEEIIKL